MLNRENGCTCHVVMVTGSIGPKRMMTDVAGLSRIKGCFLFLGQVHDYWVVKDISDVFTFPQTVNSFNNIRASIHGGTHALFGIRVNQK